MIKFGDTLRVSVSGGGLARRAAEIFCEEVRGKCDTAAAAQTGTDGDIVFFTPETGDRRGLEAVAGLDPAGAEGYRIRNTDGRVYVCGADERGVLYGCGELLRRLSYKHGLCLKEELALSITPAYPIRGHQLAYRPKTNAYDAWDAQTFDRYIRDLALFGANGIELLPPRTDDDPTGPLMKMEPLPMMVRLSQIIKSYGMDVWVFYPNLYGDYANPDVRARELAEREEIFKAVPFIDHLFIPGGDPGGIEGSLLFGWVEEVASLLVKYHPDARIWLSSQVFHPTKEWLDSYFEAVNRHPWWLRGLVFGPWVRNTVEELKQLSGNVYPVRHYPDICHNYHAQYPVPNWNLPMALTLGRECMTPRPEAEKLIHNTKNPGTCGTIAYSEGINDDVNKFIWTCLDVTPERSAFSIVREYASYFIDEDYAGEIASAIMLLEENLKGPLSENPCIEQAYETFRVLEAKLGSAAGNYRFQLAAIRAYADMYIKRRYFYEKEIEAEVCDLLEQARETGAAATISQVMAAFEKMDRPPRQDIKRHIFALADSLFDKIGAQLTVERHGAIGIRRGAFVDGLDDPVINRRYITARLQAITAQNDENEALAQIEALRLRRFPGPGGRYDCFMYSQSFGRVARLNSYEKDPGNLRTPFLDYTTELLYPTDHPTDRTAIPLEWIAVLTGYYDTPVAFRYDELEHCDYNLTVTTTGPVFLKNFGDRSTRVLGNGLPLEETERVREHIPYTTQNPRPVEEVHGKASIDAGILHITYHVPAACIGADGALVLVWKERDGKQGPDIAEMWLRKAAPAGTTD